MSSIMTSDIENRISKLKLAKDKFLMPLFEAISNSLQAIEDRFGQNNKPLKCPRIRILSVHFSRYFSLSKSTEMSMKWTPVVLKSFCL